VTDDSGYVWKVNVDAAIHPASSIANASPGNTDVNANPSGSISIYNETPGRTASANSFTQLSLGGVFASHRPSCEISGAALMQVTSGPSPGSYCWVPLGFASANLGESVASGQRVSLDWTGTSPSLTSSWQFPTSEAAAILADLKSGPSFWMLAADANSLGVYEPVFQPSVCGLTLTPNIAETDEVQLFDGSISPVPACGIPTS
jgi:hypothetical protein